VQNAVVNGNGRSYVVALPDNDAAASIADRLGGPERVLASHVCSAPGASSLLGHTREMCTPRDRRWRPGDYGGARSVRTL